MMLFPTSGFTLNSYTRLSNKILHLLYILKVYMQTIWRYICRPSFFIRESVMTCWLYSHLQKVQLKLNFIFLFTRNITNCVVKFQGRQDWKRLEEAENILAKEHTNYWRKLREGMRIQTENNWGFRDKE